MSLVNIKKKCELCIRKAFSALQTVKIWPKSDDDPSTIY